MEVCYNSACAISNLPAESMKDKFWIEWKELVHTSLDTLASDINNTVNPIGLVCRCGYSRERTGATLYLESASAGRKWVPPLNFSSPTLMVPDPLFSNPPFQWPAHKISPENAFRFQKEWVTSNANTHFSSLVNSVTSSTYSPVSRPAAKESFTASATSVPICNVLLYSVLLHTGTPSVSALADEVARALSQHLLIQRHPYTDSYRCSIYSL
ncbi:hypothetical protein EON65_51705 [archaeon]|nr:MAG: hypothetical protein EON65_51705 [archaeon]